MDLRCENDVEQLRRIAIVQDAHLGAYKRTLSSLSARIDALTGKKGEEQQAFLQVELMSEKALREMEKECEPKVETKMDRKPRQVLGPTPQPWLPIEEQVRGPSHTTRSKHSVAMFRCFRVLSVWAMKRLVTGSRYPLAGLSDES